jgi:hypothetical protein
VINCFRMDFSSRTPTRPCYPQTTCGAHRSQFGIHVLAILGDIFSHGLSRHALNWIVKFILSTFRRFIWSDSFSCYLTTLGKLQGFRSVDLGKRWLLMLNSWGFEGGWSVYVFSYCPVFSRGTCMGLNGWIPVGGHVDPSSIIGDSLVWKNAQKNETKNRISEARKTVNSQAG